MVNNNERFGKIVGHVTVRVIRADGTIEEEDFHNLVVNAGKSVIAGLIGGLNTSAFTYVAIGTGTTAEAVGDTALEHEVKRKQATASQTTTSVTNDTLNLDVTFSSADGLTGTTAVTEYGIFDAATGGNMLARVVKAAKNMDWDAGDQLQVIWTVQVQ